MIAPESTLDDVHRRIDIVKARTPGGFVTNYFRAEMVGARIFCASTDHTVLFANEEHDFLRLFFFSTSRDDLDAALRTVVLPGAVVCGYLTKVPEQRILDTLANAGFAPLAVFRRMTHARLPTRTAGPAPAFATLDDLDEIHGALFSIFNRFTDHLPTRERLRTYIANQQVLVNRRDGQILAAIIFQLLGRQVNYNYLYSRSPNPLDLLMLQSAFYRLMATKGIRSGFLWVDRTNHGTIRMQQSLGWSFDGLEDHFHFKQFSIDAAHD